ncbi:MAG: hypothetical protein ACXADX_15970 [Candidatus Hodarchaeales archaeon]
MGTFPLRARISTHTMYLVKSTAGWGSDVGARWYANSEQSSPGWLIVSDSVLPPSAAHPQRFLPIHSILSQDCRRIPHIALGDQADGVGIVSRSLSLAIAPNFLQVVFPDHVRGFQATSIPLGESQDTLFY